MQVLYLLQFSWYKMHHCLLVAIKWYKLYLRFWNIFHQSWYELKICWMNSVRNVVHEIGTFRVPLRYLLSSGFEVLSIKWRNFEWELTESWQLYWLVYSFCNFFFRKQGATMCWGPQPGVMCVGCVRVKDDRVNSFRGHLPFHNCTRVW